MLSVNEREALKQVEKAIQVWHMPCPQQHAQCLQPAQPCPPGLMGHSHYHHVGPETFSQHVLEAARRLPPGIADLATVVAFVDAMWEPWEMVDPSGAPTGSFYAALKLAALKLQECCRAGRSLDAIIDLLWRDLCTQATHHHFDRDFLTEFLVDSIDIFLGDLKRTCPVRRLPTAEELSAVVQPIIDRLDLQFGIVVPPPKVRGAVRRILWCARRGADLWRTVTHQLELEIWQHCQPQHNLADLRPGEASAAEVRKLRLWLAVYLRMATSSAEQPRNLAAVHPAAAADALALDAITQGRLLRDTLADIDDIRQQTLDAYAQLDDAAGRTQHALEARVSDSILTQLWARSYDVDATSANKTLHFGGRLNEREAFCLLFLLLYDVAYSGVGLAWWAACALPRRDPLRGDLARALYRQLGLALTVDVRDLTAFFRAQEVSANSMLGDRRPIVWNIEMMRLTAWLMWYRFADVGQPRRRRPPGTKARRTAVVQWHDPQFLTLDVYPNVRRGFHTLLAGVLHEVYAAVLPAGWHGGGEWRHAYR